MAAVQNRLSITTTVALKLIIIIIIIIIIGRPLQGLSGAVQYNISKIGAKTGVTVKC